MREEPCRCRTKNFIVAASFITFYGLIDGQSDLMHVMAAAAVDVDDDDRSHFMMTRGAHIFDAHFEQQTSIKS